MWSGYRRSGTWLRCFWVVFVIGCALYITEPALFSRIKKGFMLNNNNNNAHSCPPCTCDCPPSLSLMNIAPGLVNLTITECGKDDPELNKEMEKELVDRLTDELKLHKAVTEEHAHHMNMTYIAARKVASQYQKEAEKCNTATETCEEGREQIEALLIKERKMTSAWELRARKLGWEAS